MIEEQQLLAGTRLFRLKNDVQIYRLSFLVIAFLLVIPDVIRDLERSEEWFDDCSTSCPSRSRPAPG